MSIVHAVWISKYGKYVQLIIDLLICIQYIAVFLNESIPCSSSSRTFIYAGDRTFASTGLALCFPVTRSQLCLKQPLKNSWQVSRKHPVPVPAVPDQDFPNKLRIDEFDTVHLLNDFQSTWPYINQTLRHYLRSRNVQNSQ